MDGRRARRSLADIRLIQNMLVAIIAVAIFLAYKLTKLAQECGVQGEQK